VILNELGRIADQYWRGIPQHFPFVELAEYVVMPNHVHGIININKPVQEIIAQTPLVETQDFASREQDYTSREQDILNETQNPALIASGLLNETHNHASLLQPPHSINQFGPQSRNLGSIIRGFKSGVKSYATTNRLVFHWQERFHDHIIRDDMEYRRIAHYIVNNPANWRADKFYCE